MSALQAVNGIMRPMRTFIAIEIPEPLKQNLDRSMDLLRSEMKDGLIRWVRTKSMHLTLRFLGEIEQVQVRTVQQVLDEVAVRFSTFALDIAGFGCFPNSRRPRVIWAGIKPASSELLRLEAEVAIRMEGIGFERERREFHPHLTLGRVRKGMSRDDLELISRWAQDSQIGTVGRFEVEAISLIHSVLQPDGATYTSLHVARLAS
jgi:2'-5' RNA ligase